MINKTQVREKAIPHNCQRTHSPHLFHSTSWHKNDSDWSTAKERCCHWFRANFAARLQAIICYLRSFVASQTSFQ